MANGGPRFQARDVHNAALINQGLYGSVVDSATHPSLANGPIALCIDAETAIVIAEALNRMAMQEDLFSC